MQEVQSNANLNVATHGAVTLIRHGAAALTSATGVSVNCLRDDWVNAVSTDFRPRDAPAARFRDTAA